MSGSPGTDPAPGVATEGRRLALVVAVTDYVDAALRRLRAPAGDAAELRDLLADPEVGAFSVTSVVNEKAQQIRLAIEDFLAERRPDDVLLIYLSCHGLMDTRRRLYFAARDTIKNRLASSGVESQWLFDQLEDCRARRQIVILDCCFSGAFASGAKGDDDLGLGERLVGEGRGRVVLTASRGSEYSFEGEPLQGEDDARGSVFTSALIAGIRSGEADTDDDGDISVDDAYTYAFEQVRASGTPQTPQRWLYGAEGSILLAHTPPALAVVSLPGPAGSAGPEPEPEGVAAPAPAPAPAPKSAGPSADPVGTGHGPRSRRRKVLLAVAGALALGAAVLAGVLLARDDTDPGPAPDAGRTVIGGRPGNGGTAPASFSAESPWRLRIKDDITDVSGGDDVGCDVTLTNHESGNVRTWEDFYGTKTFQMRESGTFRSEVSDPGCLLLPQRGDGGAVALPFTWSMEAGDSPVFENPGVVTVLIEDRHGTSTCDLSLMADSDGRTLDSREAEAKQTSVPLESPDPGRVFIAATTCSISVSR